MRGRRVVRLFVILLLVLIVAAGFGLVVQHLWNWLMPAVFGLHLITYWQALGLLALCWILFRGPRGWMAHRMHWRHRMRERWARMTPEEREKFRAAMLARCGGHSPQEPKT